MKKLILFISFITLSLLSHATIHVVDSLNDSGTGSLRAAASNCAAGDTIRFNPNLIANGSDSIVLTTNEIYFGTKGVVIKGLYNFNDTLYLSGNNTSRIFSFNGAGRIVLDSLVLINGNGTSGGGGAIKSENATDTLFVANSIISRNIGGAGAGILASSNSLTIPNSVVIINSTISDNNAGSYGGGIRCYSSLSASVTVINSTISGNSASSGGGIYSYSNSGSSSTSIITVINSTISGNSCTAFGGGIFSRALGSPSYSVVNLNNSTIYGNTSSSIGDLGGVYSYCGDSSSIIVTSSIIAENGANSSGLSSTSWPIIIISNGNNVFSDSVVGVIGLDSTNVTAAQLNVKPLAFNGGFTQTMLPGTGSVALDNGNPNDSSDAQNAPVIGTRNIGAAENCFAIPSLIYETKCFSYTVPSGNSTYIKSGVYTDTLVTTCGADSVIYIDLTITNNFIETYSACSSFTWRDGVTYTQSNFTAQDTVTVVGSCDSVFILNLTINSTQEVDVVTSCNSYTWIDGVTYTSSNSTATYLSTNSFGCDSLVTLNLTINNSTTSVLSETACDSYTSPSGNHVWTTSNVYIDTIPNAVNCDSIITINLTINNSDQLTDVVFACDSYTWIDGITYTSSNDTSRYYATNALGCDSVITLDLTINNTALGVANVIACDSFTFNGVTYTTNNNTAKDTLMTALGCDSIVTLNLVILQSTQATDNITSCSPITWIDGNVYDQTTLGHNYILPNSIGCDSVVTLNFTLLQADTSVVVNDLVLKAQATNASFRWLNCEGFKTIPGMSSSSYTVTKSGSYAVEVYQNGCIDTSACFTFNNVGITEPELIGISLYPNPTSDVLNIDKGTNTSLEITITNSAGATVHHSNSINQITTINMAQMATGMYVVTLKNELGIKVEKVVKR